MQDRAAVVAGVETHGADQRGRRSRETWISSSSVPGDGARRLDGAITHDLTVPHLDEARLETAQVAYLVLDNDHCDARLGPDMLDDAKDLGGSGGVQVRGRLVKDQHLGLGRHHGRYGHLLLLAA